MIVRVLALGFAVAAAGTCQTVAAAEYQPSLAQIGVTPALHATNTGAGVKIAVLDGYADYDINPDLSRNHGRVIVVYPGRYRFYDLHATHVSGIIGAAANNWGVVGVAPGATLYSIPVFDDRGWVATDLGKKALDTAVANGVQIVNMSYGPTAKGDVFLNGELNLFDDYLNKLLIVRAAGNSGVNAINEAYAGKASTALANLLIVGSVNANNQISSFSTRPGEACIAATATCAESEKMKYFVIVAPGENILSDAPGQTTTTLSGTSMATPAVVGAAALVIADGVAKKVILTPADVASILKHSATDLGAAGVDGVYGWGLLNVPGALAPVGTTFIATGGNVTGGGVPLIGTGLRISSAFVGARYDSALAGGVFFDEYGRPYGLPAIATHADPTAGIHELSLLAASLGEGAPAGQAGSVFSYAKAGTPALGGGVSLLSQVDDQTRWLLGFGTPLSYFAGSDQARLSGAGRIAGQYLTGFGGVTTAFDQSLFGSYERVLNDKLSWNALVVGGLGNSLSLSAGKIADATPTANLAAAGLSYRLSERALLAGSLGLVGERGSVMGSVGGGPFALGGSAVSGLASVNLGYTLDAHRSIAFYADAARTTPTGNAGALVGSATALTAARAGVSFSRSDAFSAGDRLTFLFGRPLTVAAGSADIRLPTGREFDGTVDYATRTLDFGAARMPLEAGFSYQAGRGAVSYGLEARVVDADVAAPARLDAHLNAAVRIKF